MSDQSTPLVGVIMGSRSDWETMQEAAKVLDEFGVASECQIVSAHRTPQWMVEYAESAEPRGLQVVIAGAGGARALAGHGRFADHLAGTWRAGQEPHSQGSRFATFHRTNAWRRASRYARHWRLRSQKRGLAGHSHSGEQPAGIEGKTTRLSPATGRRCQERPTAAL